MLLAPDGRFLAWQEVGRRAVGGVSAQARDNGAEPLSLRGAAYPLARAV